MSFIPLRVDGGGVQNVFDVATAAVAALGPPAPAAGTTVLGSDTHGLYVSTTSPPGNTWTIRNKGIGVSANFVNIAAVKWSVTEPNTIYALAGSLGAGGGLLVSADGGLSWALRSGVPQSAGNHAKTPPLASGGYPRQTGRLLVQDPSSTFLFAGTYSQGVLRDPLNGRGAGGSPPTFPTVCTMGGAAPGADPGSLASPAYYCRALVQGTVATTLYGAFFKSAGVTVAAASNGVLVSSFTGAGVLKISGTTPFGTGAGTVGVITASGNNMAVISYTSASSGQLTGCTYLGGALAGDTVSTASNVITSGIWTCTGTGATGPQGTSPNFTQLTTAPFGCEDLLVLPNGNIYAACGIKGLYRSLDSGANWTSLNGNGTTQVDLTGSYWSSIDGYTSGGNDILLASCSLPTTAAAGVISLTTPSGSGTPAYANKAGTVQITDIPTGPVTAVAAASAGGSIASILTWASPSAQQLNTTSAGLAAAGFPATGDVVIQLGSGGYAVVHYTGLSGGNFTGCTYVGGGTGTTATGNPVNAGYSWWYPLGTGHEQLGGSGWDNPYVRFDPTDATHQAVYICGGQGFYRSADGGASWTVANSGAPNFNSAGVGVDQNRSGHCVFTAPDYGAFDDSNAGAENATTLVKAGPTVNGNGYNPTFDPSDSTVWIGTHGTAGQKYTNNYGEVAWRPWNVPTGWAYTGFGNTATTLLPVDFAVLRDGSGNRVVVAVTWGMGIWRLTGNPTTVAAGSNTINVSTFTGAGVLNVASTTGYNQSYTATSATPCVFTVPGAGYANGTQVTLGGSVPTGFTAGTVYYVVAASGSTFQLAATLGGTALGSTSAVTTGGTVTPAGSLAVQIGTSAPSTFVTVSYTGTTSTSFTGCTCAGSGVLATGGAVNLQWVQVSSAACSSSSAICVGNSVSAAGAYVYAFDQANGIFRSADYGATWTPAAIWTAANGAKNNDSQSGGIAAHPLTQGEVWVTAAAAGVGTGKLYKLTGADTGTFTSPAAVASFPAASPACAVAISAAGTIVVTTEDTGNGSSIYYSVNNGATWINGAGDTTSFSGTSCSPASLALGPASDPRVYVGGVDVVSSGYLSGGPVLSAPYTFVQAGPAATGSGGSLQLHLPAASTAGTALIARIQCGDGSAAITPPAGWALVKDVASGAGSTNVSRVLTYAYLNNPGGLAPPASPLTFTCFNPGPPFTGELAEFSTPAGTWQFADQPPGTHITSTSDGGAIATSTTITSLPVAESSANTVPGGLAVANFAVAQTGGPSGQTWSVPAGWTADTAATVNTALASATYYQTGITSGPASVSGTYGHGASWTSQSSAAALATFYAFALYPVVIQTLTVPPATNGTFYTTTITATGGGTPYVFSWAGTPTLPPGLSLNAATGVISGTPGTNGNYSFNVTCTDAAGQTDTNPYAIQVTGTSSLSISNTSPLTSGTANTAYAGATLIPAGGTGTGYSWAGTTGLPNGLILNTSTGAITGMPTMAGTYTVNAVLTDSAPTTVNKNLTIVIAPATVSAPTAVNSLVIADQVELMGGPNGVPSANPACAGAIFLVQPGYDLGAPVPSADIVASLILDGSRPSGYRAENRTVTLPLCVVAPDFATLAGAYEVLMRAINEQSFTLTWWRAGGKPLVLDCFRASTSVVTWGGIDQHLNAPWGAIALTFTAMPYGRSDVPVAVTVPSPLPGQPATLAPVVLDTFSTVSGAQWTQSGLCVTGPHSAWWNPGIAPLSSLTGKGSQPGAVYTATVAGGTANLTGLTALSVYAGLGSDYYRTWHKGPVVFAFTLTDASANTLSFSRTITLDASDESGSPRWRLVTAPVPQGVTPFNYAAVTSYKITVTNRGDQSLRYTHLYLDALTANPPSQSRNPALIRGAMYRLYGVQGTARTPCSAQFQQAPQAPGSGPTVIKILAGPVGTPQTWVCPPGVTSISLVECTGAGGGACLSGGAGGGYRSTASVAVTPNKIYYYTIGKGGTGTTGGAGSPGQAGGATTFTGDSVTVTAGGGAGGSTGSGTAAGGTGAFAGGAGGSGTGSSFSGGGGGAAGSGGAGFAASGSTPGAGSTSGATDGGSGGTGTTSDRDGYPGMAPGGGGGGTPDVTAKDNQGGNGADGQIQLTYSAAVTQFSTLIAHRPGPAAPPDLAPLITFGLTDVPNGTIEYPVPSLTPGVYATFGGTYTVVVVGAAPWASPASARTVTITVKQYEFAGSASYSTSVSRTFTPATDTFTPGGATLAQVPIVVLGELTLPLKDVAPDNTSGLYTITINDTNGADAFLDCLLLDTLGQTVAIGAPLAAAYTNFYVDEPSPERDLGRVMGSSFGRAQAVSVLDSALVSGGNLYLDPGDAQMLVYAVEGAPALSVTYFPRWFLDRLY